MPFAELNGAKIYYMDEGEGTPVVLITGFSGDCDFYRCLVPSLTKNHRVIRFDNRGAGQTVYGFDGLKGQTMVDDAIALFDYLEIDKAHLLGWSLGGHVAQEFAYQFPERLKSLTLVSAYPYRPARSSYFMNGIVDCALRGGPSEYISMMTNAFCFPEEFFAKLESRSKTLGTLKGLNPKGLKDQMNALDEFDTREKVSKIKVPTLSIHGLDDIMVEPKMGDYISDRIPGCKKLRIPGMGHIIHPSTYEEAFIAHINENE